MKVFLFSSVDAQQAGDVDPFGIGQFSVHEISKPNQKMCISDDFNGRCVSSRWKILRRR